MDLEGQDLDMLFTKIEPLLLELNKNEVSNSLIKNPLVSICLITYNHAEFLSISLDAIFAQKTNFEFEVIIGDDCSSDGTQDVIKNYLEKYPNRIKCFLHPFNLSKTYKEFTPGKLNFLHGLYNCSGKYIVHIEGDDYFTDDLKLQKQVDLLEANPQYAACFHNALMKFEDGSDQKDYLINPPDQKREIYAQDLLKEREAWFMATAAVMFRSEIKGKLPFWFSKSKSGDIPLYVLLSQIGPIVYLPENMSVYRRHDNGMSYTDNRQDAAFVANRIYMYDNLNKETKGKYKHLINPILSEFYIFMAESKDYGDSTLKRIGFVTRAIFLDWPNGIKVKLGKAVAPNDILNFRKLLHKLKLID